jgi:hypothetical protein
MPRMLGSHEWSEALNAMSLVYGYPHPRDVSQPLIEVMTCFSAARCYRPLLEEALVRADHRDAAYARDEWADVPGPFEPPIGLDSSVPVPANGFAHQDRAVIIDGEQRVVPVVSYRRYEALRFHQDTKIVTAVARSGFPEAPSFHTVDDLGPYAAGFRRFMLSVLRRGMGV